MCLDFNAFSPLMHRMVLLRMIMTICLIFTLSVGSMASHASASPDDHDIAHSGHHEHVIAAHDHEHDAADAGRTDPLSHVEHDNTHCCSVGACSFVFMESPFVSARIVLLTTPAVTDTSHRSRFHELDSPPPRIFS